MYPQMSRVGIPTRSKAWLACIVGDTGSFGDRGLKG